MKKILFLAVTAIMLASCQTDNKPLYSWSKYESVSYAYLKIKNESFEILNYTFLIFNYPSHGRPRIN
jgi:hypothetical protein